MRIVLSFSLLLFSVIVSQLMLRKYSLRVIFFSDFSHFNNKMINQVNFENKTLLNIVEEVNDSDFKKMIKSCLENKNDIYKTSYLFFDEEKIFYEYCELLGRSDQITQNKHLNYYEKIINEKLETSKIEEKSKKILYTKMGLMIGFTLFIIFV